MERGRAELLLYGTKVQFKYDTYDYSQGKNVTLTKSLDKVNRDLADYSVLCELGNLVGVVIGCEGQLLDTILIRQDSIMG